MAVLLCQSASLVQQDTSSHSFLSFFFLNALFSLLQARQSSTFFEPHSSNSASLPLLTHNIQRTSRTTVFFVFLFLQVLKNALHSFFPDLKFFFYLRCFTCAEQKEKKRKRTKVPKCAAAWCKWDRTSLWLGTKSSLLASFTGFDEAKKKKTRKQEKHVCSTA